MSFSNIENIYKSINYLGNKINRNDLYMHFYQIVSYILLSLPVTMNVLLETEFSLAKFLFRSEVIKIGNEE